MKKSIQTLAISFFIIIGTTAHSNTTPSMNIRNPMIRDVIKNLFIAMYVN